jgi:hypothetical protein
VRSSVHKSVVDRLGDVEILVHAATVKSDLQGIRFGVVDDSLSPLEGTGILFIFLVYFSVQACGIFLGLCGSQYPV